MKAFTKIALTSSVLFGLSSAAFAAMPSLSSYCPSLPLTPTQVGQSAYYYFQGTNQDNVILNAKANAQEYFNPKNPPNLTAIDTGIATHFTPGSGVLTCGYTEPSGADYSIYTPPRTYQQCQDGRLILVTQSC